MVNELLPERTVERLSKYRRVLLSSLNKGVTHIYSHTLASLQGITPVQVRRDLMLIGFSCDNKKGYNVKELIGFISTIIDSEETLKVAIIGMGNLASAITTYFDGKRSKLRIVSSFDVSEDKVGHDICGIPCYHISEFEKYVRQYDVRIVMLTLPSSKVGSVSECFLVPNIKGVLNFTSVRINIPERSDVYVEDYDIITLLEKVAYFTKELETV